MKKYIKFTENNDWEGESWNFYLPLEGNEDELKKLEKIIEEKGMTETYEFGADDYTESEVDILVKRSEGGYMANENKVTGKLLSDKVVLDDEDDNLYKGGIISMFK